MTVMKKNLTELELEELAAVSGGSAYDTAEELARFMDWLMNKYNCYDARKLKQHLTPEEKARICELRDAVLAET